MPYAEDSHIREAFKEHNFLKLRELLNNASSESLEAEFYRGILAENILNENDDLNGIEKAKKHYEKAFSKGSGVLKAGNYLARIYQKGGELEKAKTIYKKITGITPKFCLDKKKFIINYNNELCYEDVIIEQDQIGSKLYLKIRNSLSWFHESDKESRLILTELEEAKIAKICQDQMAIAYASYRLARIEAEEIINQSLYQTEKDKQVVNARRLYKNALDIYKEIAPDSKAYMKSLYHQGKLELRVLEQEQESISGYRYIIGDNPGKSEIGLTLKDKDSLICKINGEEITINVSSHTLKIILDRVKNSTPLTNVQKDELNKAIYLQKLQTVREIFQESKDKGYEIAEAEILNIDARFLSPDGAIAKYDKALKIDPKNNNAKLMKAKAIEVLSGADLDNAKYDQSLKLVREVLVSNPENSDAKHYIGELQRKISRLITSQVQKSLTEKVIAIGPQPQFFDDKYLMRVDKENIVGELCTKIAEKLSENDFIKNKILFSEVNKIAGEITDKLWIDNQELFQNMALHKRDRSMGNLITASFQSISEWESEKKEKPIPDINTTEIGNRILFKKQTTEKLNRLYRAFMAATEDDPLVKLNVSDGSFVGVLKIVNDVCPYGAALCGPFAGGPIFAAVGAVAKWGAKEIENHRQEAACKAAKAFCEIGNQDEDRAKKIFEEVAQHLINTYGIQIDKLDEKGIEKLSDAAVERMLCHVNNQVSYGIISDLGKYIEDIKKFISEPSEYSRRIGAYLSGDKERKKEDIDLLIEGIIEGESASVSVTTKKSEGEEKWEVNEVFTKPAVTTNGKVFYYKDSDLEKYGVRKEKIIPKDYQKYKEGQISPKMDQRLKKDFQSHKSKLDIQSKYEKQQKREEISYSKRGNLFVTKDQDLEYLEHLKKEEILCIDNKRIGYIGIYMAIATTCVSAMLAIASVSSITPLAVALGVSGAFFPPLAVATLALGGWLFVKGVQEIHKANKRLNNIIDASSEIIQSIGMVKEIDPENKQKELQDKLVEKLNKNAKYSDAERGKKVPKKNTSFKDRVNQYSNKNVGDVKHNRQK